MMRALSAVVVGGMLAVVLMAALMAFAMGLTEPEKRGSLAIAGAILGGSTIIAIAIMSRQDDGRA
jgi:hypothetical protein